MEPPTISIAPKPLEKPIESALGDPGKKPSSDLSQHMPEDSSSVTPEDSFATVRLQYLELLYVSKVRQLDIQCNIQLISVGIPCIFC
jgi:hypothetical protein